MRPMIFAKYKVEIFLLLFSLLVYSYFISSFHSANESSHFALIRSIVDQKTFIIDTYRDYASIDVAFYKGHYYTDKMPGLSVLGIPVYWIDLQLGFKFDWQFFNSLALYTTIFSAVAVVLVYRISRLFSFSSATSFLLSLVYGFGTLAWVFSKTFFAHPYSAFFVLLSIYFILLTEKKKIAKYAVFSGISLGILATLEYANLAVAGLLALYFVMRNKRKYLLHLIIPIIPFAVAVLAYNYSIFGSPFLIPLNFHYSFGNTAQTQWFKFSKTKEGLNGLLVSTSAGLLYLSPILLLSIVGFKEFFKKNRLLAAIFAVSFLSMLFFFASSESWHGGNSYGPRYLLFVVPFLIFPIGFVIEKYKDTKIFWLVFILLLTYSVVLNGAGALNDPTPAEIIKNPFLEHNLPNLMRMDIDSYFYRQNKDSLNLFVFLLFVLSFYFAVKVRKIISFK